MRVFGTLRICALENVYWCAKMALWLVFGCSYSGNDCRMCRFSSANAAEVDYSCAGEILYFMIVVLALHKVY
jgi:hypothetical protein